METLVTILLDGASRKRGVNVDGRGDGDRWKQRLVTEKMMMDKRIGHTVCALPKWRHVEIKTMIRDKEPF